LLGGDRGGFGCLEVGTVSSQRRMTNAERRARLVVRHHLGGTAGDVLDAVRCVAAMHSSDPVTPYLGVRARLRGFAVSGLEHALYEDRSLLRIHAMRRTLFVVPSTEAPLIHAAAGREDAARERRRLEGWVAAELGAKDGKALLTRAEAALLELLGDGRERGTREIIAALPELGTPIIVGSGTWATRVPLVSRLVLVLGMERRIVRGRPAGSWRSSQYRWAVAAQWVDEAPKWPDPAAARVELARRYLATHGPATLADLRWWAGWTARHAAAAIASLRAVPVQLEDGGDAFVLPGDDAPVELPRPTVAFLPGLDSTPMGWKERSWFLGEHGPLVYDRNGNAGPTVWVDGRIVGAWSQDSAGEVVYRLLEDVGSEAAESIAAEAASLTHWLGGDVVATRFPSPLERELAGTSRTSRRS